MSKIDADARTDVFVDREGLRSCISLAKMILDGGDGDDYCPENMGRLSHIAYRRHQVLDAVGSMCTGP
jgi:hypothetical protein